MNEPNIDGNTPLVPQEVEDLIPDLTTQEHLNEWEFQNILAAQIWALQSRTLKREDPFSEPFLRKLHFRMFDQTWKWAGTYRTTEKNIGVAPHLIRESLGVLLGDARYWLEHSTFPVHELSVRYHHRLVWIHPFPNGNGRHARMVADFIARKYGGQRLTWGSTDIVALGEARQAYLQSMRAADTGDFEALLKFAVN